MSENQDLKSTAPICSGTLCKSHTIKALIIFAVLCFPFIIRNGFININSNRDFISVTGRAEKAVQADFSVWIIPIIASGDDFIDVRRKIDYDTAKVRLFLKKYQITDQELELVPLKLFDKTANRYYDENSKNPRFFAEQSIIIRSANVEQISRASKNLNDLIDQGLRIFYEGENRDYVTPKYLFTRLQEIKLDMLSAAIEDAEATARKMLLSSHSKIGNVKHIAQGNFETYALENSRIIYDNLDKMVGNIGYFPNNNPSYAESHMIEKVIKVSTNVEYYIR